MAKQLWSIQFRDNSRSSHVIHLDLARKPTVNQVLRVLSKEGWEGVKEDTITILPKF
jgi:hypothetical protein